MKRPFIPPDADSHGVGPLGLDIKMARGHGWTQKQIERVAKAIGTISRREGAISHRKGRVPGCPCVVCDFNIKLKELPEEYRKARSRMVTR